MKTEDNLKEKNVKYEIGGEKEKNGKFVPNLNLSFNLHTNEEYFFLNINRKNVTVNNEKEEILDSSIKLKVGQQTDIWHVDEDGRLKWDIQFDSRPSSNVFEWELKSSPNLQFWYQDSLENEYAKKINPDQTLEEYLATHSRPENVVGSYAVYQKQITYRQIDNQGNTVIDGGCGKLIHIYRPLCFDANGQKSWAELFIDPDKNLLRITIPQEFLDNAIYPVLLDPTFGNGQGSSSVTLSNGRLYNSGKGTPASNGTVTSIDIYSSKAAGTTEDYKVGLYTDSSGEPLDVVGTELETVDQTTWSASWKVFNTNSLSVSSGTYYWPAFIHNGIVNKPTVYYDDGSSGDNYYITFTYTNSWEQWDNTRDTVNTEQYSMRATYTESSTDLNISVHDCSDIKTVLK